MQFGADVRVAADESVRRRSCVAAPISGFVFDHDVGADVAHFAIFAVGGTMAVG